MTLGDFLAEAVSRYGARPLLVPIGQGDAVSYEEFNALVNGLAHGLQELGVKRGERVGAILPNGPELLVLWFAAAKLGAVLVPFNPALAAVERAELLAHAEVTVLIGVTASLEEHRDGQGVRTLVAAGEEMPGSVSFSALLVPAASAPDVEVRPSDPVAILYTSGTTGRPKGCVLTHESYVIPAYEFRNLLQAVPEDRFFACLPLFHMAGQSFAASAMASGASLVLVPKFSGSRFWEQVSQSGATVFRHLGEMLAVLLQSSAHPLERAHNLRAVYGGGARPELLEAFQARFGVQVVEGYGLSETNTVLANSLAHFKRGSIGKVASYHEVRVAGDDGQALAAGEVGEIQVRRNRVMMQEYFKDPNITEQAFSGVWYRTGDLGWQDEDGYFYFVSRKKDIIRRRGENIAPAGIEAVLNAHEGVAMSAVIGVPDGVGGEEIKAFVMPAAGAQLSMDSLLAWCQAQLAEFKIPRYFEVCSDLPRTATNKVNKGLLRSRQTLGGASTDRQANRREQVEGVTTTTRGVTSAGGHY
jgi:acyl-CoA synthetase (AMP-forming)/AMP-acid ligase II